MISNFERSKSPTQNNLKRPKTNDFPYTVRRSAYNEQNWLGIHAPRGEIFCLGTVRFWDFKISVTTPYQHKWFAGCWTKIVFWDCFKLVPSCPTKPIFQLKRKNSKQKKLKNEKQEQNQLHQRKLENKRWHIGYDSPQTQTKILVLYTAFIVLSYLDSSWVTFDHLVDSGQEMTLLLKK